ncbi:hypothetical protein Trydic_g18806 [Trypoxylus dichotomus]
MLTPIYLEKEMVQTTGAIKKKRLTADYKELVESLKTEGTIAKEVEEEAAAALPGPTIELVGESILQPSSSALEAAILPRHLPEAVVSPCVPAVSGPEEVTPCSTSAPGPSAGSPLSRGAPEPSVLSGDAPFLPSSPLAQTVRVESPAVNTCPIDVFATSDPVRQYLASYFELTEGWSDQDRALYDLSVRSSVKNSRDKVLQGLEKSLQHILATLNVRNNSS